MTLPPLTHHEIIGLVEPFVRRGRQVDLGASDRIARRLAFKPIERLCDLQAYGAITDTLTLDCSADGVFRLTRTLALADGPQAALVAKGADLEQLLGRVEAVAPQEQFDCGSGFAVGRSYRLEGAAGAAPQRFLTRGQVHTDLLTLTLRVTEVRGGPGEIELAPADTVQLDLPEDLLAVQGWAWGRLRKSNTGWSGSVRLRGSGIRRSQDAAHRLQQVTAHLSRTLAEPPARFHERRVLARWGVFVLRSIPILASVAVISGLIFLQYVSWARDSITVALILIGPPFLFMVYLGMRDVPGVDKPPLPRRPAAASWRRGDGGPD